MANTIENVRLPDEVKFSLNAVCNAWSKHAETKGKEIRLKGLSEEQKLSFTLFYIASEVDEVLGNINIVLCDLEQLSSDHTSFGDFNPFKRYMLLVRTFFYEFGRFEDLFGYFTQWCINENLLTKKSRRELRNEFYKANEAAIRTRNTLLHDSVGWEGHFTPEISLLQSADIFGSEVLDADNKPLEWKDHLSPLCKKMIEAIYEDGKNMQILWNMVIANIVYFLVKDGRMKKANKRFQSTTTMRRST